jgi:GNAT superfamily N-acetyltransferase
MYTEPALRRSGVAKQLLEAMLAWCRKNEFSSVSLHASVAGRPLYEKMGLGPTNKMILKL